MINKIDLLHIITNNRHIFEVYDNFFNAVFVLTCSFVDIKSTKSVAMGYLGFNKLNSTVHSALKK